MSSASDTMSAAVANIEAGLLQLASGFGEYQSASQELGFVGHLDVIHVSRLADWTVRRMRALGLQRVLDAARTEGRAGPEWVDTLTASIERQVS